MTGKRRLDSLLAERGLFPSRSRAAASVMAGEVFIAPAGPRAHERRAAKPGELVHADTRVRLAQRPAFVSRGGVKLANALAASGLHVAGRRALDVGASTGGFTDCLLQHGAREVIALDVGYGALDYRLRRDPRVCVLERTNARALTPAMLPPSTASPALPLDLATIDVSFISLRKLLAAVLGCLAPRYDVLALVKPQFELERARVGKGGVVRAAEDRREALTVVARAAIELGAALVGAHSSGLPGPKGNRESFLWLTHPAARRGSRDPAALERIVAKAEPHAQPLAGAAARATVGSANGTSAR
ncbi:MAG TPA: TlyA family RNA methyltransferase [Solirubrobacteraceae bacterium]|nr:TlyA family RNA methyltransferase [Solirubrobacteraceae bacterium]